MKLRPYQQEAKEKVLNEWEEGRDKTLLVLPTGTGKTIVFSKIVEERVRKGDRVLILAHRGELLEQASDKLEKSTGLKTATEKANETSLGSWFRVVVGSVQTLMREKRLMQFSPDYFGTIIVDEAHHVMSESYQKVLNHFSKAKILGVTATPDRGDMKNLGAFFESLAFEYSLPKAIKDGYLAKIKALTIPIDLDLSSVTQQAGDFKASELGNALDPYLEQIANEMWNVAKDRKIVVFLPLIDTSKKMVNFLNNAGFNAVEVNGNSKDREEILSDFDKGKYNVLCNSMLLTEGWDCPSVDCVVVLRPTKVRSLYSQMVGRGTRLYPGKDHVLLLDFLWHTERHALCRPSHLITTNEKVQKKMDEKTEQNPNEEFDIEELEAKSTEEVIQEREQALAEQLKEMRKRKRKLVDPIQFEMSIQDSDIENYVPNFGWEIAPASKKQISALEKYGILPDSIDNAGKANLLLDKLNKRRDAGLATPKQIRFLENKGFLHVGTWQFDVASKMISRISMNNWRIPQGVNPETYKPGGINEQ
ncbi:DEAD/DEAH box helicase [Helcococcus kunzii]|uniref:DEAD/DEAH box helicase n=1 Tax=Helcococcus kunzii TaxID=40091 RepID=UPI001BB0A886|nr:DEAD/DEAH box helicase [Helcococcus kunzii]QUY65115.1 DEAD/DEAH box helicase [Helcococcus kunzii]